MSLEILPVQLILFGTWAAVMLIYLLGDVLRIISGDLEKGEELIKMRKMGQPMWMGIASLMLLPILFMFLSLIAPFEISKWMNIIGAVFFFLFNLVGLPTYRGWYDKFLLVASMIFNLITIYYAWVWVI